MHTHCIGIIGWCVFVSIGSGGEVLGTDAAGAGGAVGVQWETLHAIERTEAGFRTVGDDPFMVSSAWPTAVTGEQRCLLIELRASSAARVQFFWMGDGEGPDEARTATLAVQGSTAYVTYALDLAAGGRFAGFSHCRLDMGDGPGLEFDVRGLRCVRPAEVPGDLLPQLIRPRCYTSKLHYQPGERIAYRVALEVDCYPDRASSKVLSVVVQDEAGRPIAERIHQYGLRPGSRYKEIQGDFNLENPLPPGQYRLKARSVDQRSGFTLDCEHEFGVQGPDDPRLYESPFKFVKDFSLIRGPDDRWHVFSITGDFFDNHDWVPDGQERTFSHASSADLVHWTQHPPVISISDAKHPDGNGYFKNRNVWAPHVIRHAGRYWMFYTSVNEQVSQSISLATSADLFVWEEYEHNPVFTPEGVPGVNWARDRWADCRDPMVLQEGDTFYLYATVNAAPPGEVGGIIVAESRDLLHWSEPRIAVRGKVVSESPQVFKIGDSYCMTTSSIGGNMYVSDHPARGWRAQAFPRPDIAGVERYVRTSGSYAEEVVAWGDGELLMASLTFRHWGNSIYFFRVRSEAGVPIGYERP